jgi:hypothetical protein
MNSSRHRIGDVAEFQIEEYSRHELGDSPNPFRPLGGKELAAYFDQTGPAAKPANKSNGLFYVWEV